MPYSKLFIISLIIIMTLSLASFFFLKNNLSSLVMKFILKKIYLNFVQIANLKKKMILFPIISLFILILMVNYLGLLPFSLCVSSHISLTVPLALFFFTFSLVKLKKNDWKNFFLHLIMNNIPLVLSPFLILIESIGVFIRPITLSIRLAANMTSGHMIMFIICSMFSFSLIDSVIFLFLFFICLLEMFVCLVQSYVFSMLSILYISSSN